MMATPSLPQGKRRRYERPSLGESSYACFTQRRHWASGGWIRAAVYAVGLAVIATV
jgi:hypothetical protein